MTIAQPAHPSTRELRALELFERHGHRIAQIAPDVYRVPSQDGERSYDVLYGEREECPCPDHQHRGLNCVHIYAVGISLAKRRRRPCACVNGLIYIGYLVGAAEVVEAVPCNRCQQAR